jgi:hypothetical protein
MSDSFRDRYLDHDTMMAQLEAWARDYPDVCRLSSLGTTAAGRVIPLITIGYEPERLRPAVWVDANMHASELAGCSVVMAFADDLLALHRGQPCAATADLPDVMRSTLRDGLFYLCPRVSPDGAEVLLKTHRFVRSVPLWRSRRRLHPRWLHQDVDGDGFAHVMRKVDPAGDWVPLASHPDVLRPRRLEDAPPYYKLYPEGVIEHFDGHTIPDPYFLSDNDIDLNRNFPGDWKPEPHQVGAGPHALSESESLAVVTFATEHPNIFAWLNLHCFGGVLIRPLGDAPDHKMDPEELPLWRQLEEWARTFTGYPTVSGFEEFTYEPEKPLSGDLSSWAHTHRGAFAWVVELWDIFAKLGVPRPKRFVDYYDRLGEAELVKLAEFDREHNGGRIFPGWRVFQHPQLGQVEVGGMAPLIGIWNPPESFLPEVCLGQSRTLMRVSAMAPRIELEVAVEPLGDGLSAVRVGVVNTGYLPTWFIPSAKKNPICEPLWLTLGGEVAPVDGLTRVEVGQLSGWGQGHLSSGQSIIMPRSGGSSDRWTRTFVVRGTGALSVEVASSRVGTVKLVVSVGVST